MWLSHQSPRVSQLLSLCLFSVLYAPAFTPFEMLSILCVMFLPLSGSVSFPWWAASSCGHCGCCGFGRRSPDDYWGNLADGQRRHRLRPHRLRRHCLCHRLGFPGQSRRCTPGSSPTLHHISPNAMFRYLNCHLLPSSLRGPGSLWEFSSSINVLVLFFRLPFEQNCTMRRDRSVRSALGY
jgi:hypothetical protein